MMRAKARSLALVLIQSGILAVFAFQLAVHASAQTNDPVVLATIKPIHAMVSKVMGQTGEPKLLVNGAASPHTYSLKPSDAKALNEASIFFRVSEEIEPFTRKIVASLPKSVTVVTLGEVEGLHLLDKRKGDTFEAHSHGEDHEDGHQETATVRDAHVWLDPQNGVVMVREIARALSEANPEKAAIYQANTAVAIAEIEATAKDIDTELAPLKANPFVAFHDAYQYFEARFGIPVAGTITVSPDVQPSAKRLREIRNKIKELGVTCVFAEPQFKSSLVATVLEGTGAKAGTLDPEGASVKPGPNAYVTILKNLAQDLRSCMSG